MTTYLPTSLPVEMNYYEIFMLVQCANRHLHENWGENSFSQLGDESKIPESKQGLGL